ncbi:MAG: hypothetical protein KDA58_06375 [Planctomycetaceae bacterium]|nr:hypothetical protein [Planctomycetaceae bacterium]
MKIDLIYFDAASGHRAAAEAIQFAITQQHPDWIPRLVNAIDLLQRLPLKLGTLPACGIQAFNWGMRRENNIGFQPLVSLSTWWHRHLMKLPQVVRQVSTYWTNNPPDLVLSVTPMWNPLFYKAARLVNPDVQCVTVPVDYSEACTGYWFTPKHRQVYFIGDQGLAVRAITTGIPQSEIIPISGMPIDPRFHAPPIDTWECPPQWGLNPELPLGVISFGGQGTVHVLESVKAIADANIATNLVCLCGRNQHLRESVRQLQSSYPVVALEYRSEPPVQLLHRADYLIGKPGTMTLNEALLTRTPLLFLKSRALACVQEQNEKWILSRGLGTMIRSPAELPNAIESILADAGFVARAEQARHRGVFDVVAQLAELVR